MAKTAGKTDGVASGGSGGGSVGSVSTTSTNAAVKAADEASGGALRLGAAGADDAAKVANKVDNTADVAKTAGKTDDVAGTVNIAKATGKTDDVAGSTKTSVLDSSPQVLKIPQGLTLVEFDKMSSYLLENVGHISSDIRIQGSRAAGTAKVTSDIDIAIMVDPSEFSNIIKQRFKTPNPNSAKERTMNHAVETGKIQSGEAGLRGVRKQLERDIGLEVDISIIKKDGAFDNPPYIQINK